MFAVLETVAGLFVLLLVATILFVVGAGFLVPFVLVGALIWLANIAGSLRSH